MKKSVFALLLCFSLVSGYAQNRFWITTIPGAWSNTANWSTTTGGVGGASVPGAGNLAVFNGVGGRNGACLVDLPVNVGGITISGYTGIIDLAGNSITTTGTNIFTSGTVANTGVGGSVALNNITLLTTFNGTAFTTAQVTGTSGNLLFNGSSFGSAVNVTKANNTNDNGTGNNTFNGAVTFTNTSANQLLLGSTNKDTYNSTLTVNINSTGAISLNSAAASPHLLNGNVVINYNSTGNVIFGNGNGQSTLAAGKTITVGALGVGGSGNLTLNHFTASATAQNIALGGNATSTLTIGPASVFAGPLTVTSPGILLTSSTFSAASTFTKNGSNVDNSTGGNTFTTATFNNTGSGDLVLANTSPDTFNGSTVMTNNGTGRIQVALSSAGNLFAGDLTLNHNGTTPGINFILARNAGSTITINGNLTLNQNNGDPGSGIIIANDGAVAINGNVTLSSTAGRGILLGGDTGNLGTVTLGNGFTVKEASAGAVTTGQVSFYRFTQVGSTAQTVNMTGTSTLFIGQSSVFNGNVNFTAPQVLLNGATYNGTAFFEKNGNGNSAGTGGNVFGGAASLLNSSTGQLILANSNPDTFNGDLTVTNTGSNIIYLAHNSAGNQFNGNVILNENGGTGIYFSLGGAGASSTMASGKTLSIGGTGFSTGQLRLYRFTQLGTAPVTLNLTGSSVGYFGPSTTIGGNFNLIAAQLYLQGTTFIGITSIEKNGGSDNYSDGGNTFTGTTTLLNSSTGVLAMANLNPDTYNGDLTANNTGTNWIFLAHNVGGNAFNGNIAVGSNNGKGIIFSNNPTGFGTQAASKTITISALGYSAGELRFRRFTQLGNAPVNLILGGTSLLRIGPAGTFGGDFNAFAPDMQLEGGTFNGQSTFEKNGVPNSSGNGGNVFMGNATLINSGSGYFVTANGSPDIFNGDLTATNTGSSGMYIAHNVPGTVFNGNIIVNSNAGLGVLFSNNPGGASTQLAGKTITVGPLGFSVGDLGLKRFSQNAPVNLTLTGVAQLRLGPASSFGSTFTSISPQVYLDGATYGGNVSIEKNGAGNSGGAGGNVFNGATLLTDSGSGFLQSGVSSPDIFNGDLTLFNSGSDGIYMAHAVPGTQFNGNIIVNETSGLGIYFSNNVAGSSTLAIGKTISVGASSYLTGDLKLARFTQLGAATPQALTLFGPSALRVGPSSAFSSNVNFVSPQLYLDGCTYSGTAYLEKNGATSNSGIGNNTFNSTAAIVNSGSNNLRTNGNNLFSTASINATGSGDIMLENLSGSTYNGDLTFTNTGSAIIHSAFAGATAFNGNLIFNNTSAGGVYFGEAAGATATLADTKTLSIGGTGFNNGQLLLQRFTQVGTTAQSLVLTGVATLKLGGISVFNANVDFRSPQLFLDGATYNGVTYLEKTGATGNGGNGNNTFATTATIVNSGSSYLRTPGNNTFNGTTVLTNSGSSDILLENTVGDTYNGDLTLNNTGSGFVRMSYLGTTAYNGNIIVNSTGGIGVYFGEQPASVSTLATGKTITTGGIGFSGGNLQLMRFTQVGPAAQLLVLTANASLFLGPASTFNGNLNFKAPQVFLQGATYNGTTLIEKTGAVNNDSNGNNVFNGLTTIANSGSGFIRLARVTLDQFNNDLTLTNTGTERILLSDNVPGSTYNGNITVNCTNGLGIWFGNSNGSSTLATGKTISVGGLGFTIGELKLQNFTQVGATSQVLALTGLSDIRVGPSSAFNGNVDFRAPQVLLDGATYNGTAYIEKNGATNNTGVGNNVFGSTATFANTASGQFRTNGNSIYNGATTFLNSSSNDIMFEAANPSTYNGDVTFTNTGSSNIRVAFNGAGTTFNGNIIVNSTNATGIFFCEGTGTATLANGKTIAVGVTGFTAGELRIQRFTQTGATSQVIAMTGSGYFHSLLATTWNGSLNVSAPTIQLDGSTYNGTTSSFTKTGNSSDNSVGGNTFNTNASFTNNGTGNYRLANTTGDAFNGNAAFIQTSGTVQPAYAGANTITGDITVTSAIPIIFGTGGGTLTFSGAVNEGISKTGAASPTFTRLIMGKTGGSVTLNSDILISTTATFGTGVINSTAGNFINFANGATATGASNASYVDGPVRKTGTNAFVFPTGNAGIFRSIAISNPAAATDAFTAQYFKATQVFGGPATYAATLVTVSSCEYWALNRTTGVSNVSVTLSWNSPDCVAPYITDLTKLRVARWSGANWLDLGTGGTTGTITTGTVASAAVVTTFGNFALSSTSKANPLPIELISFSAVIADLDVQLNWLTASELNNDHFDIERSYDGQEFRSIAVIQGAGTSTDVHRYDYLDLNPGSTVLYYRLKQTDFDGNFSHTKIIKIVPGEVTSLIAWPNPSRSSNRIIQLNYTGNYQLYDSRGFLIGKTEKSNTLDTTPLGAGVYLLRADNGLMVRLIVE